MCVCFVGGFFVFPIRGTSPFLLSLFPSQHLNRECILTTIYIYTLLSSRWNYYETLFFFLSFLLFFVVVMRRRFENLKKQNKKTTNRVRLFFSLSFSGCCMQREIQISNLSQKKTKKQKNFTIRTCSTRATIPSSSKGEKDGRGPPSTIF